LAAAGTKTPGQKIWFYSIRVPKPPTHPVIFGYFDASPRRNHVAKRSPPSGREDENAD
jgi:hypothetical protein